MPSQGLHAALQPQQLALGRRLLPLEGCVGIKHVSLVGSLAVHARTVSQALSGYPIIALSGVAGCFECPREVLHVLWTSKAPLQQNAELTVNISATQLAHPNNI